MTKAAEDSGPTIYGGPERRKLARVMLRKPVTISLLNDGGAEYFGMCENASADGMLLFAEQKIPEHSRLKVVLVLPSLEGKGQIQLSCYGEVLRISPATQAGRWGIAIEFFDRSITWGQLSL